LADTNPRKKGYMTYWEEIILGPHVQEDEVHQHIFQSPIETSINEYFLTSEEERTARNIECFLRQSPDLPKKSVDNVTKSQIEKCEFAIDSNINSNKLTMNNKRYKRHTSFPSTQKQRICFPE
jgi:hypothetical protein